MSRENQIRHLERAIRAVEMGLDHGFSVDTRTDGAEVYGFSREPIGRTRGSLVRELQISYREHPSLDAERDRAATLESTVRDIVKRLMAESSENNDLARDMLVMLSAALDGLGKP